MSVQVKTADELLRAADKAMAASDYQQATHWLLRLSVLVPADVDILLRLAVARRASGDVPGALEPAHAAVELEPTSFSALLMTGSLFDALGRRDEAAAMYERALAQAPDRRQLPPPFIAQLEKATRFVDAHRSWRQSVEAAHFYDHLVSDDPTRLRLELFRQRILSGPSATGLPWQFQYSDLTGTAFYDPRQFEGVTALEQATDVITTEFRAVAAARAPQLVDAIEHGVRDDTGSGDEDHASGRWTAIRLIDDGRDVPENAYHCPQTIALYRALMPPEIAGRSPNLMFSILDPHTKIPAHHGVTNTRLVLHIPLLIPDNCGLRVGREVRTWERGKALIFDDTLNHEAWNDSGQIRIILLGDIWHPDLSPAERTGIAKLMARADH